MKNEIQNNIVACMKSQHAGLRSDAMAVLDAFNLLESAEAHRALENFSRDLKEHLRLENNIFYVKLLERMRLDGRDTKKTEQFISEMVQVGEIIDTFLEKCKKIENIKKNTKSLGDEFRSIYDILVLRIESEEEGVYMYGEQLLFSK